MMEKVWKKETAKYMTKKKNKEGKVMEERSIKVWGKKEGVWKKE